MDATLIESLRYRSEGADLDFKQAQYRFVRGTEADKSELLKDVLAMANAWREGAAYILIGFRDARPSPAEVVGIGDHIDDAALQQFINSKVKPKVSFRYEEHTYEGKTVAVLVIPKQQRPFYLQHPYGSLKSNVVYVRRGSSTDEAEPPEVAKMAVADNGRGDVRVELDVSHPDGESVPAALERGFVKLSKLPDYELQREYDRLGFPSVSIWHANRDFYRELGKLVATRLSVVELHYSLTNQSGFALTGTKLEVRANHLDGHDVTLLLGEDLPDFPESQYSTLDLHRRMAHQMVSRRDPQMEVEDRLTGSVCIVRLGTLLPGETAQAPDTLALRMSGPGRVMVVCRILAAELQTPLERELEFRVNGGSHELDLDGLMAFVKEPLAQALLAPVFDGVAPASDDQE